MTGADLSSMRSDVSGHVWPPVPVGGKAALAALVLQLDRSQWFDPSELAVHQRRQLGALADHLARNSKAFRDRLDHAGLKAADLSAPGGLAALPLLRRRDVQLAGERLACAELPRHHKPSFVIRTSGSTGEPVTFRRTSLNRLFWMAFTARDHLWHGRAVDKPISYVRARIPSLAHRDDWGAPMSALFETGPSQDVPATAKTHEIFAWLQSFRPVTMLISPSSLDQLARHCRSTGETLDDLAHVWTTGETLSPAIQEIAREVFGVSPVDLYSSEEAGILAIQCPQGGLYHVMAESTILEVLDSGGRPCKPGEIGRVVVTDLVNFATPIVRYDTGDYAEAAGPCPCGRGLPTLKHVMGRERNLIVMPDGNRVWPHLATSRFRDIAPILQYQFIQHDLERIEARFVAASRLGSEQEDRLKAALQETLGYPFMITFTYFSDEIPRSAGGKLEQFISKVA